MERFIHFKITRFATKTKIECNLWLLACSHKHLYHPFLDFVNLGMYSSATNLLLSKSSRPHSVSALFVEVLEGRDQL